MNVCDLISKKVYSIYEGNEIGYVLNVSFDSELTKLDYLVVVSLYEENEMILKFQDVIQMNNEAVFINSEKLLSFDVNAFPNNPIGKKIFSVKGEFMGRVEDVEISKNFVKKIIGSQCEIMPKNIFSIGNDCMFFSKNKIKKSKIIEKNKEINVNIQKISFPYKQKCQGDNLLGKKILSDILDKNHIVSYKKNTIVTPKIIIDAKQKGLLKKQTPKEE
jgi:sporulation protein YlmC with PRC-barrel domain